MLVLSRHRSLRAFGAVALSVLCLLPMGRPAGAEVTAFKQAVAEAAAQDEALSRFYRSNGFEAIWTGGDADDRARRVALIAALEEAPIHGLPAGRYDLADLRRKLETARTPRELGQLEAEISRLFLRYARDVQTGILEPRKVDSGIVRRVPYRDRASYLTNIVKSNPRGFFRALPPQTGEYRRLMKAKLQLQRQAARGGWGPVVRARMLEPGDSGPEVVALRNRLIAMGYMKRSMSRSYDAALQRAVQSFQAAHGLTQDGVAGPATLSELNRPVTERLQSVLVAMERERWLNRPRGARHVLVNLTDFSAKIMDNDKVTFQTRSVIGATASDRRSPEFSDVMEHMVINPTWNVPRSIAVKEYLPKMKANPNAASQLKLVDARGRTVSRSQVNFNAYTEQTFPFNLKEPPSPRNALGLVKFMFPNKYNIYLHDTPAKSLFQRESRAFSHGCIRLHEPFEFAYALLARQTDDPKGLFHSKLDTGRETVVKLKEPVPVHLIYRTAFTTPRGEIQFRRDVYDRDAKIWQALAGAGVALDAVQG